MRPAIPRLIRIVGGTPARSGLNSTHRNAAANHEARSAAALALALYAELDSTSPLAPLADECIRAGLIRWRMTLDGAGAPVGRRLRRSPAICAAALGNTADLLLETARHQNQALIDDLRRHAHWLTQQPAAAGAAGAAEAVTALALIGVAALVRDAAALQQGRDRLGRWLATQNEEGWFPDEGGNLDLAGQFALLDTLARVHARCGWDEVDRALRRLAHFLARVGAPPTCIAGSGGGFDAGTLAAFGWEWAAQRHDEAVRAAMVVRRQAASQPWAMTWVSDVAAARLCAALVRAAEIAADLNASSLTPNDGPTVRHFRSGAVSVYDRPGYRAVVDFNRGGLLRVWWRSAATPLVDPPPLAIHASALWRISPTALRRRCSPRTATCAGPPMPTTDGVARPLLGGSLLLRPVLAAAAAARRALARLATWIGGAGCGGRRFKTRHVRSIVFADRTITILDSLRGLTPCLSVVCADSAAGADGDEPIGLQPFAPQYFPGGRDVRIRRVYRECELVDVQSRSAPRRRRRSLFRRAGPPRSVT